jgi:protein TIF31
MYLCQRESNEQGKGISYRIRLDSVDDDDTWRPVLTSMFSCVNRVINKVLTDFGEASLLGIKAIFDGHIAPMNPNEPARTQVYLHNNIFFSRAIDAGIETFKIAKGDKAARKSASRDVACLGAIHRMEKTGLYTLATVLIDYLGSRFVCQSILPGILSGEKSHTLLYGTVEAGFPLTWDKEMHDLLEDSLGKLWIANRPLPRDPLTEERLTAINEARLVTPLYGNKAEEEMKEDAGPTVEICGPVEAKGIKGSDQRNYVLDMTRLAPRDANWVEKETGGTGYWENLVKNSASSKSQAKIPKKLNDDEWTLAVLRPELVQSFAQWLIAKYLSEKKEKKKQEDEKKKKEAEKTDAKDKKKKEEDERKKAEETVLDEEDMEYIKSLRMNVNVFLPDIKSLEDIDDAAFAKHKEDEGMARNASKFLWDQVIPRLTYEIRTGLDSQLPHDGKNLTEFLHNNGINCRYLGRLATLAQTEEKKDRDEADRLKQGKALSMNRKTIPHFWLELLECEMVARAAKHVLDVYLAENGGMPALYPMQTVASFLCALISSGEESAAQTEKRMGKRNAGEPDEDAFNALTLFDDEGDGDVRGSRIRGRTEVWNDIEQEIARRYRYNLTLFNRSGKSDRATYIPLLRRVCQRTGVRLAAKSYEFGGKCMCSGGGQIAPSYPISPIDVVDIVPLMKHFAAHGNGFTPCTAAGSAIGLPALHISLPDARVTLETAHRLRSAKQATRALDLAQEACSLYQRVAETPAHPGVVSCIDLIANILAEAGESNLAASNLAKSLGLLIQVKGFDSHDSIHMHLLLFQVLIKTGKVNNAIKHMRAAIFLMELMGGPRHPEIASAYHKLGTVYHGNDEVKIALQMYEEGMTRGTNDRILEGTMYESFAIALTSLGDFKSALEKKKAAFHIFSKTIGKDHILTKRCDAELNKLMTAAVMDGSKMVKNLKNQKEEEAADAIASELEAEEAAASKKKKKKNKKKKGKK